MYAALKDIRLECNQSPHHPIVNSETGTTLNIDIKKMKELFGPVINKASELLSSASVSRVKPSNSPLPRVNKNTNNNINQPGVSNTTNQYAVGTRIKKNFDGTYYKGEITSDNGKWYHIYYGDGDQEEVTHTTATKTIAYSATLFTTGYGATLTSIINDTEQKTNLVFKDLHDALGLAFSICHPVTGKEME